MVKCKLTAWGVEAILELQPHQATLGIPVIYIYMLFFVSLGNQTESHAIKSILNFT